MVNNRAEFNTLTGSKLNYTEVKTPRMALRTTIATPPKTRSFTPTQTNAMKAIIFESLKLGKLPPMVEREAVAGKIGLVLSQVNVS